MKLDEIISQFRQYHKKKILWSLVEGRTALILRTLPETNMAPENTPLEKEVPIENHHF